MSISIALSVYVLNLHFRGHKLYPVPNWIRTFLLMGNEYSYNHRPKSQFCYENTKEPTFTANETKLGFLANGVAKRNVDLKCSVIYETNKKSTKKDKFSRYSTSIEGCSKKVTNYEMKMTQILKLFYK